MAGNASFVKMAVQRPWQLLRSSYLLIIRLNTTQLCYKCGLAGSEEGPGLPKEAQEPYAHLPHASRRLCILDSQLNLC